MTQTNSGCLSHMVTRARNTKRKLLLPHCMLWRLASALAGPESHGKSMVARGVPSMGSGRATYGGRRKEVRNRREREGRVVSVLSKGFPLPDNYAARTVRSRV